MFKVIRFARMLEVGVHSFNVRVRRQRVDAQRGGVRFENGGCGVRRGPDGDAELGVIAVVQGDADEHQVAEA